MRSNFTKKADIRPDVLDWGWLSLSSTPALYVSLAWRFILARGSMLRALGILVTTVLSIGFAQAATEYINCHWDGTAPFCEGRCSSARGEVARNSNSNGCITGTRLYCCYAQGSNIHTVPPCTPARYGMPGCHYPRFGTSRPRCPYGSIGFWPRCRKIAGATCGTGMTGTPPKCYPILH